MCVLVQIVGNGSEQQLQRELEDVLMDPSVAEVIPGLHHVGEGDQSYPTTAAPPQPGPTPPKLEMVLPVQAAQEGELGERPLYRIHLTQCSLVMLHAVPHHASVVLLL